MLVGPKKKQKQNKTEQLPDTPFSEKGKVHTESGELTYIDKGPRPVLWLVGPHANEDSKSSQFDWSERHWWKLLLPSSNFPGFQENAFFLYVSSALKVHITIIPTFMGKKLSAWEVKRHTQGRGSVSGRAD